MRNSSDKQAQHNKNKKNTDTTAPPINKGGVRWCQCFVGNFLLLHSEHSLSDIATVGTGHDVEFAWLDNLVAFGIEE